MQEIWEKVNLPLYCDYYMVSNYGRVKRIRYLNPKSGEISEKDFLLKQSISRNGYSVVGMRCNNKEKICRVHRLVALTFIENPYNYTQINHIDGNKQNNNVSNLEWCNPHQNISHAIKTGLFRAENPERPVYQFSLDGKLIKNGNLEWKPVDI